MQFTDIQQYYDETARAWAIQFDAKALTMHPLVRSKNLGLSRMRQLRYLEELVISRIDSLEAHRIFDLGCGFGSSMLYMSNIYPELRYSGIGASSTEL